jgi:transposase
VRDDKPLEASQDAAVIERASQACRGIPHILCLDKDYDNRPTRVLVEGRNYVPHSRGIGEETLDEAGKKKRHPAKRWVVERTLGWHSKRPSILVRYERKLSNYLRMIKVAYILLWCCRQHCLSILRWFVNRPPIRGFDYLVVQRCAVG